MRGHSRAERHQNIEDSDEYEEDGEGQEEEVEEEEYEQEEEEDPKPTKEELEYLELRQQIKESLRKKMKKESAGVPTQAQEKKKLPYDNYGSFFGPSQPVIAQRVLQESKSLLETKHLASKVSNSYHVNKKSPASTTVRTVSASVGTKPRIPDQTHTASNELRMKAQKLKNTRDYSFLLSDDAELPATTKAPPPQNVSVLNSADVEDSRSAPVPLKQSMSKPSRPVSSGREERKPFSMNKQTHSKAGSHKVAPTSRPNLTPAVPRKQLGGNTGNGPGRPVGPKGLPSKLPSSTMDRKVSIPGLKSSVPGVHKPPLSKLHSSVQKQRREIQESNKTKVVPKQLVSSKPQIKPPKQVPVRATMQEHNPKKKPARRYSDEDNDDEGGQAISMIRKMFGYNPERFAAVDDDDSDMEANFDDILKEERKSARIAREEDERELRLIEEEERRERMRKLKRRKQ